MDGFGDRLRRLRKSRDVTQSRLAEFIGVVPSAIGKYERQNNSYPSVEALIKIGEFFDVSIDFLLKGVTPGGVENNINGSMSNSPFIQANNGGVVFNGDGSITPEAMELLHIYEKLGGRDRLKLLNFAVDLEGGQPT